MAYADIVEESPPMVAPKPTPITPDGFIQRGVSSKHDKLGILDENTKVRQNIARMILDSGEVALADKELMSIALKAMDANDKLLIAQARISVDEEANNANKELVSNIVSEIVGATSRVRSSRDNTIDNYSPNYLREVEVDIPEYEIADDELVTGNQTMSEEEILKTASR